MAETLGSGESHGLHPRHPQWRWLALDAIALLAFVLIGRDTHEEGNALVDVIGTAAPLLGGLVAGWVAADALRRPLAPGTGVIVAAVSLLAGLGIRRLVFGDGIAAPFVLVAAGYYLLTLVGWRLLAGRLGTSTAD